MAVAVMTDAPTTTDETTTENATTDAPPTTDINHMMTETETVAILITETVLVLLRDHHPGAFEELFRRAWLND